MKEIPTAAEARDEIALRNLDLVLESMVNTMSCVTELVLNAIKNNQGGATFFVKKYEHIVHPLGDVEDVAHYISYRMEGKGYDIETGGTWIKISWRASP